MRREIVIGENDSGKRLDAILRALYPSVPLSRIFSAFRKGEILMDDKRARADLRVPTGARILVRSSFAGEGIPDPPYGEEPDPANSPTGLASEGARSESEAEKALLFSNDDLAAFNKPPGITSHGPDSFCCELEPWLRAHSIEAVSFHPAPLHRLDRGTSGILFFGLSLRGARRFSEMLREHRFEKSYLALLEGALATPERWDCGLSLEPDGRVRIASVDAGGKPALTEVVPAAIRRGMTLGVLTIRSGRKHQIRIHAGAHGFPLAGDRRYGGSPLPGGYILHAFAFSLPGSAVDPVLGFSRVTAPLPDSSRAVLQRYFTAEEIERALKTR
jgi:23S rRNA pseudouridine955/2504/2580 synthase